MILTGVDGCKAGWIAISQDLGSGVISADVHYWFVDLVNQSGDIGIITIDIPIGLTVSGPRTCDTLGRKLLGKRHSTIFPAPIRPALGAATRLEASEITRAVDNRGVGAQAWNIYKKVREVDACLRSNPSLSEKVFEVHPELSFRCWNEGFPIPASKKSQQGKEFRKQLISQTYGPEIFGQIREKYPPSVVAVDDIADAFAALWTAVRIQDGSAASIPDPPEVDSSGLRMAISY